jgi:hypothetical protein
VKVLPTSKAAARVAAIISLSAIRNLLLVDERRYSSSLATVSDDRDAAIPGI